MKKRIISIVLVFVLMCSMCFGASADTYKSEKGTTSGGTSSVGTSASLRISANAAVATTGCALDSAINRTVIALTYQTSSNTILTISSNGNGSATEYPSDCAVNGAISASSSHSVVTQVNGGWTCGLSVNRK